jgi:hypothetical protein
MKFNYYALSGEGFADVVYPLDAELGRLPRMWTIRIVVGNCWLHDILVYRMTQVVVIYKTSYYQLSNLDTLLFYNHHIVLPLVADLIRRQTDRVGFPFVFPSLIPIILTSWLNNDSCCHECWVEPDLPSDYLYVFCETLVHLSHSFVCLAYFSKSAPERAPSFGKATEHPNCEVLVMNRKEVLTWQTLQKRMNLLSKLAGKVNRIHETGKQSSQRISYL